MGIGEGVPVSTSCEEVGFLKRLRLFRWKKYLQKRHRNRSEESGGGAGSKRVQLYQKGCGAFQKPRPSDGGKQMPASSFTICWWNCWCSGILKDTSTLVSGKSKNMELENKQT